MDTIEANGPNAQQIEFWNGEAGTHWSERDDQMSRMLRPLGAEAIALAAPRTGEWALDIGCALRLPFVGLRTTCFPFVCFHRSQVSRPNGSGWRYWGRTHWVLRGGGGIIPGVTNTSATQWVN